MKASWLIFTFITGMLPFIARLLIFCITKDNSVTFLINNSDFIVLGLVLNLSNINELMSRNIIQTNELTNRKTKFIIVSSILAFLLIGFLFLNLYTEYQENPNLRKGAITIIIIVAASVSLLIGVSIFKMLDKHKIYDK